MTLSPGLTRPEAYYRAFIAYNTYETERVCTYNEEGVRFIARNRITNWGDGMPHHHTPITEPCHRLAAVNLIRHANNRVDVEDLGQALGRLRLQPIYTLSRSFRLPGHLPGGPPPGAPPAPVLILAVTMALLLAVTMALLLAVTMAPLLARPLVALEDVDLVLAVLELMLVLTPPGKINFLISTLSRRQPVRSSCSRLSSQQPVRSSCAPLSSRQPVQYGQVAPFFHPGGRLGFQAGAPSPMALDVAVLTETMSSKRGTSRGTRPWSKRTVN